MTRHSRTRVPTRYNFLLRCFVVSCVLPSLLASLHILTLHTTDHLEITMTHTVTMLLCHETSGYLPICAPRPFRDSIGFWVTGREGPLQEASTSRRRRGQCHSTETQHHCHATVRKTMSVAAPCTLQSHNLTL